MSTPYVGNFTNREDVLTQFAAPRHALRGATVLLAWYGYGDYSGSAFVLYRRNGKLFEVNGSHCSCNGLEDQWKPEETSWKYLASVLTNGSAFDSECSHASDGRAKLERLVRRNAPAKQRARKATA